MRRFLLLALLAVGAAAPGAGADPRETLVPAFAGSWIIVDAGARLSELPCRLHLSEAPDGGLSVETAGCDPETAAATGWDIVEGQLVILVGDAPLVRLGGNPGRLSGATDAGRAFILERPVEGLLDPALAVALDRAGCFFLGYSSRCATDEDLAVPETPAPGQPFGVSLLVNLNVRIEPRDDAPILGTADEAACIMVDQCVTATDGLWCRAAFGGETGWFRRHALRRNQWPVVTFEAGCDTTAAGG